MKTISLTDEEFATLNFVYGFLVGIFEQRKDINKSVLQNFEEIMEKLNSASDW